METQGCLRRALMKANSRDILVAKLSLLDLVQE